MASSWQFLRLKCYEFTIPYCFTNTSHPHYVIWFDYNNNNNNNNNNNVYLRVKLRSFSYRNFLPLVQIEFPMLYSQRDTLTCLAFLEFCIHTQETELYIYIIYIYIYCILIFSIAPCFSNKKDTV